jgi:hypothetical protein
VQTKAIAIPFLQTLRLVIGGLMIGDSRLSQMDIPLPPGQTRFHSSKGFSWDDSCRLRKKPLGSPVIPP